MSTRVIDPDLESQVRLKVVGCALLQGVGDVLIGTGAAGLLRNGAGALRNISPNAANLLELSLGVPAAVVGLREYLRVLPEYTKIYERDQEERIDALRNFWGIK